MPFRQNFSTLNILKLAFHPYGIFNHFKMQLIYSPFCDSILIVSMVKTRRWQNSMHAIAFYES